KLIDYYKTCLKSYEGWKHYDFKYVKETDQYKANINEFYSDVAKSGYRIWFESISAEYISKKNSAGDLFLFELHNKDFAKGSTGSKNLHTIFFESVFSEVNMQNNFP